MILTLSHLRLYGYRSSREVDVGLSRTTPSTALFLREAVKPVGKLPFRGLFCRRKERKGKCLILFAHVCMRSGPNLLFSIEIRIVDLGHNSKSPLWDSERLGSVLHQSSAPDRCLPDKDCDVHLIILGLEGTENVGCESRRHESTEDRRHRHCASKNICKSHRTFPAGAEAARAILRQDLLLFDLSLSFKDRSAIFLLRVRLLLGLRCILVNQNRIVHSLYPRL